MLNLKYEVFANFSSQAAKKFPQLDSYEDYWPVTDLLKMRLKQTAEQTRRAKKITMAEV